MNEPFKTQTLQYESVLEAYKKGELWPTGPCQTTGCSAEGPIDLNFYRNEKKESPYQSSQ